MKRLAFLLSGHMRSFEITFPSFQMVREDLEKDYKVDVFIHTWDMLEPETSTYHDGPSRVKNRIITDRDLERYNPVLSTIDTQYIKNPDHKILVNQCYEGLLYAEYSKFIANHQKGVWEWIHGVYDVVICSRPDIYYYTTFPKDELEQTDKIWLGHVFHNKAACDMLIFSSSENINIIRNYSREYETRLNSKTLVNNESYFLEYLAEKQLPIVWSKYCFPRDFKWIRSWWSEAFDNPPEFANDPYTCHTSFAKKVIEEDPQYEYYRR